MGTPRRIPENCGAGAFACQSVLPRISLPITRPWPAPQAPPLASFHTIRPTRTRRQTGFVPYNPASASRHSKQDAHPELASFRTIRQTPLGSPGKPHHRVGSAPPRGCATQKWGRDFILPPAFWPALFGPPVRRRPKGRRQDEILTPHRQPAWRTAYAQIPAVLLANRIVVHSPRWASASQTAMCYFSLEHPKRKLPLYPHE
jgi:hypothetical protein